MKMEERDRMIRMEGREEGIQVLIETYKELGFTKEDSIEKVCQKFSLTRGQAEEFVAKYWE